MLEITCRRIRIRGKSTILTLIMTAAVLLTLTGVAGATPIGTGTVQWSASNLSAAVSPTCINFFNASQDACPPGTADALTTGASDAIFGGAGVAGTTKDYLFSNQVGLIPGSIATYNNGTAFMTLASGFTFDVNQIFVPPIPTTPPTPACSPVSNPTGTCYIEDFTLTQQSPTTVLVGFTTMGIGYVTGSNPATTGFTPFTFTYSSQVPGSTIAQLVAAANSGQTIIGQAGSLSAIGVNTPEPMTFFLMGLGLLGIGLIGRFRRAGVKGA